MVFFTCQKCPAHIFSSDALILFFYLLDVFKIDFGTQSKLSRQFLSVINAYLQGKIDYLKIKISRQSNF